MRIQFGWLLATAAAYGVPGGWLLYDHVWSSGSGLAWTDLAGVRIGWAAVVFLFSSYWLARRNAGLSTRPVAVHVVAAFLLGGVVGWGVLEYLMSGGPHPWDTQACAGRGPECVCISCAPRMLIVRQTLIAAMLGAVAAAGLAPLVARRAQRVLSSNVEAAAR